MSTARIPDSVIDGLSNETIDCGRIVADINTIVSSKRYAIYRLIRINGLRVELTESTLDPQVSAFMSDILSDETSDFSRALLDRAVPYIWDFSSDPVVIRHTARKADPAWLELARSRFHVFFRRSTPAETLLYVAQSASDEDLPRAEEVLHCQGLLQVVFDQVTIGARARPETEIRITVRERECLRWCAEGKTSDEIAIILSLSTHTVNHYLISATKKLNAVNRMHAITTAVRLGILDINSVL